MALRCGVVQRWAVVACALCNMLTRELHPTTQPTDHPLVPQTAPVIANDGTQLSYLQERYCPCNLAIRKPDGNLYAAAQCGEVLLIPQAVPGLPKT